MALTLVKTIAEAETILKEKLDADLSDKLEIVILKEGRLESFRTNHKNGSVIIHYDGSTFSDPESRNIVHQNRNMRFVCLLQVRVEKGIPFRNEMIEAILLSLAGYKFKSISRSDRMRPASDEYLTPEREDQLTYFEHPIVFVIPAEFQEVNYLEQDQG